MVYSNEIMMIIMRIIMMAETSKIMAVVMCAVIMMITSGAGPVVGSVGISEGIRL